MWCIHNFRAAIMLAAILAADGAGCGFRPLLGASSGGAREQLATVRIAQIPDRVGQKLHNILLDRLTPDGPPARPQFVLSVGLNEARQDLAIRKDETATRANLTLTADFALKRLDRDETYVGTAVSTNSYNILQSDFATLSAEIDARDRALRMLAEEIRTRVAAALTNPVFFTGPTRK